MLEGALSKMTAWGCFLSLTLTRRSLDDPDANKSTPFVVLIVAQLLAQLNR